MMNDSAGLGDYGANGYNLDAASVEASLGDTNGHYEASGSEGFSEIHGSQELTEEDKYWKNVRENTTDFSSWTYLVQLIEKQGDIEKIRKVYDDFLVYFPLCFFYWKKYADHEATRDNIQKAIEVYERGVHAVEHSVELWMYYCSFVSEKLGDLEHSRILWERGAATVGNDFASHTFWDKYIEFETSHDAFTRVIALYLRILQIPLEQLAQYHARFKTFVTSRPLSELLLPNEEKELEENKKIHEQRYNELTSRKEDGEAIDVAEIAKAGIKTGDEVEVEFRSRVMASREEIFKKTLEDVTKRRSFEHAVLKRAYFHVKPLDESMISNWRKYLDMEERESTISNPARVVKLYERCLMAACYYSEFWLRYAKWLEAHRGVEKARAVFVRATTIFLVRRADLHLEYALFEELHGDIAKARQIYEHLANALPGHVESTLRHVAFERRQGRSEEASAIYETALSISSLDSKSGPFLCIHYCLFLERVLSSPQRVRDTYEKALPKFPDHKGLWMAYIQFECAQPCADKDKVLALYARIVAEDSKVSAEERLDFWLSYVEYVSDWVDNLTIVRKVHESFRTLYPTYSFKAETARKRPLFDPAGAIDNPSKVPRSSSTSSAAGATPAAAAYAQGAAAQYPYPYSANQYAGYAYPTAGYTYPYTATAGTPTPQYTTAAAGATAQYTAAAGYSYAYPYGYTQPTS